jgi:hypothetical protein
MREILIRLKAAISILVKGSRSRTAAKVIGDGTRPPHGPR